MDRRAYLASAGTVVTSALAGCGGSGGGGTAESTTSLPPDTVQCDLVDYAFRPGTDETLTIDTGTTVRFVWQTGNHNIVVEEKPAESDWDGVTEIYGQGHTYEHEFTVPGSYHVVCEPHVNMGMVGDILVTESSDSGANGTDANGSA
ncbi:plastocyanin/azurin family copper-binding protein [Halarchaeum nitratireducens]|uniref:Blue (type 1) copper domain-containing protein n=1 Tax=Halarchaeum nitratireducens TaxID=489913 RepID=A0A830G9C4_9EURY|nr:MULTISPECIES: plastocyanin/azurin family copper-binding protein [Halarchaeum]MBP2249908.1 plastocyanin [Halarchaeum solikamskense]GGN09833.1 hypothetical protein GCM10009021_06850 [Halarchaeum nitratireducens]